MTKRISTKKKINRKLYVAKATSKKPAVRPQVVDEVKAVLLQPQFKKLQKHIERISIIKTEVQTRRVITGRVISDPNGKKKPVYKIYDHNGFLPSYYRSVAVHELAHIHWSVKAKWDKEAFDRFNRAVENLRPVSDYLEINESKWRADKRFNTNQYCNEMHSAAAELYYAPKESGHTWKFPIDQNKLLAAYQELHNLV